MPLPITATLAVAAAILTTSLTLNGLLVTGMRRDKSLRAVTYYYANSVCAAMLLQCLVTVPPGVVSDIVGEQHKPLLDTLCIVWLYMDTFLCNLVFLHCLGSAIDTWLRLRHPLSYAHSTGRGSTCLKIGAPWSVSFIQTTAEFAVTRQFDDLYHRGGACLHSDPNFVILRAGMSYALPGLASLTLLALAFRQFARVRAADGVEEAATAGLMAGSEDRRDQRLSHGRRNHQMPQSSTPPSVIDLMQRDCTAETLLLQPQALEAPQMAPSAVGSGGQFFPDGGGGGGGVSGVYLEMYRMATIPEVVHDEDATAGHIVGSRSCQALTSDSGINGGAGSNHDSWWQDGIGQTAGASMSNSYTTDRALHRLARDCALCPRHGPTLTTAVGLAAVAAAAAITASASAPTAVRWNAEIEAEAVAAAAAATAALQAEQQVVVSMAAMETTAMESAATDSEQWGSGRYINSWRRMLDQERAACTINLCLFFVSSVFWSPYMIGSLTYCLCANFQCLPGAQPSPETLADTKWVAYASCLAYPVFFLVADKRLRAAAWRAATCTAIAPYSGRDSYGNADTDADVDVELPGVNCDYNDGASSSVGSAGEQQQRLQQLHVPQPTTLSTYISPALH